MQDIKFTGQRIWPCYDYPQIAVWIGENLHDEFGFPDKANQSAEPGTGWTPAELNQIPYNNVVDCALTTLGCVEWEIGCSGVL